MVPDTRYAILGLLLQGQSHGYELATRFAELLGPGWAINRGQVYDMLNSLERSGWIERLGPPTTTRGSQSYRITHKGEQEFAEWITTPSSRQRSHRETLYLKLALAGPQDAHHLLKDIDIEKQACIDQLNAYAADSARPLSESPNEWETFAREAIDERVTAQLHETLEWLEKLRKRIEHRLSERPQDTQEEAGAQAKHRDAAA